MLRQPFWHAIWAVMERRALCFAQLIWAEDCEDLRKNLKHQMLEVIIQHVKHGMLDDFLDYDLQSSEK